MQQNLFQIILSQEAGACGNNIEKEPQKLGPNLKKYILDICRLQIFKYLQISSV